jgi:3-dehydroquinate synthase
LKTIKIQGSTGTSTLLIGERLENLKAYLPREKVVIITDTTVRHFYEKHFPNCDMITIGTGEKIKNLDTVRFLYEKLLELEVDRSSFIVGIGGGIVSDITGFVASTYMRGLRFGFVSSTLLSQVDASVGGKNGVNFSGYKNIIGVFNQPEWVICDFDLLQTLPRREILCGFAEIVKHAAIADAELFHYMEKKYQNALELDRDVIEKLVWDSVMIKSSIVTRDEREKGERRKLNFGHTVGHALEKTTGMPHGESVSIGMVVACAISEKRGMLSFEDANRVVQLLRNGGLPVRVACDDRKVLEALKKDKKKEGDRIHFVLLDGIGNAVVENLSIGELETVLSDLKYLN